MAKINFKISNANQNSETKIDFKKLQNLNEEELESWWQTVPGARNFLKTVAETAEKNSAAAAHLPEADAEGFLQMLNQEISRRNLSLIVEFFDYEGKDDLEDFAAELTEKFAPNFLRDFTEDSPMTDLAKQKVLSGRSVIVRLKKKFSNLTKAVSDFNKKNSASSGSIIFICSDENPAPSLTRLSDFLTPYDVQFFAINLLENSKLSSQEKLYASTLAAKLSGQSAILTKNLSKAELFFEEFDFVKKVVPNIDNRIFFRAVWECQIQFLLPILEQLRGKLIEKYFHKLKNILPVKDEFGKIITDAWDMELRHLHFYGGIEKIFNLGDWENLELAYRARNLISHLEIIDRATVEKIFLL